MCVFSNIGNIDSFNFWPWISPILKPNSTEFSPTRSLNYVFIDIIKQTETDKMFYTQQLIDFNEIVQ